MHILANYTLTPDEALRGTRTFKQLWYTVSMVAGACLVLTGLGSVYLAGDQRGLGFIMAFNGLLFLILPEAVLRWARLRRGAQAYSPVEVLLDDEGLTLRTEASEGGLAWAAFAQIQRLNGFWLFRISRSQAVIIPERVFDPATAAELEAFLRSRNQMQL